MTVILVLAFFVVFLVADHFVKSEPSKVYVLRGTQVTTPGFEALGALAQDGGTLQSEDAETDEILAKLKRVNSAAAQQ